MRRSINPPKSSLFVYFVRYTIMSTRPAWLTKEYLQKVLDSFGDKELRLKDFDVSSGSRPGDGYASQILRIKTNTTKKKISIIVKVLLNSPAIETIDKILHVYDKEKLILESVLPKLLTKLPKPVRFFPELYHADDDKRALFLEDLGEDGYQLCDHSSNGLDLPHSLLVMEALAKLHGTSYLVFQEDPGLIKNFEKYFNCEENKSFVDDFVTTVHKSLMAILDDLKLPEEYKKKLKNADGWSSKIIETWKRKEGQLNALIQTDCWINNLMFKYTQNGVQAVKMLDFQVGTYHSLCFDLIVFIFSSTSIDVKTKHLDILIERYFDVFTGITGNIQTFSKEQLWKEFNDRLFIGFTTTISLATVVLAEPKGKTLDLDAIMVAENNTAMYKNPKFLDCLEKLMPYFVENNAI